jgi:type II secretory pathway component PulJ
MKGKESQRSEDKINEIISMQQTVFFMIKDKRHRNTTKFRQLFLLRSPIKREISPYLDSTSLYLNSALC